MKEIRFTINSIDRKILKFLHRLGVMLIIAFSSICFMDGLIVPPILLPEIYLLIVGLGFFLIAPWRYREADERRKERGEFNSFLFRAVGAYLAVGIIFLFISIFFMLRRIMR